MVEDRRLRLMQTKNSTLRKMQALDTDNLA